MISSGGKDKAWHSLGGYVYFSNALILLNELN